MTERPNDVLAQIGPDTSFHGSSCRKHDFAPGSADISEEDTRNLVFRLVDKDNIPIREHLLTFSSGTQSIGTTAPMIAPNASSGRIAARVRVGLCEQIPTRVGEVAGQDLSASVRHTSVRTALPPMGCGRIHRGIEPHATLGVSRKSFAFGPPSERRRSNCQRTRSSIPTRWAGFKARALLLRRRSRRRRRREHAPPAGAGIRRRIRRVHGLWPSRQPADRRGRTGARGDAPHYGQGFNPIDPHTPPDRPLASPAPGKAARARPR